MKPTQAPEVPGNSDWERFDNAVRAVLAVPKDALLKKEARLKKQRARKQAAKK